MKLLSYLSFFIFLTFLPGCIEKNTDDPTETYILWAGKNPPNEVRLINGKYWQSAHWSKEYTMYLELEASSLWRREFRKQNNLIQTIAVEEIPSDAPGWFKPNSNYQVLVKAGSSETAYYYEDTLNGKLFMYEIQY